MTRDTSQQLTELTTLNALLTVLSTWQLGNSELGLLYIDPTSQQIGGNEDAGRPRTKLTLEGMSHRKAA